MLLITRQISLTGHDRWQTGCDMSIQYVYIETVDPSAPQAPCPCLSSCAYTPATRSPDGGDQYRSTLTECLKLVTLFIDKA